ncbi:RsiV family protein [Brevibacillus sp. B_LB10_24]|uniref:RsiV family protein n=1 Tax=Brevibacillus sp. B_LB10_24 TaxID=3380645 RepID=UPI0038B8A904
MHSEVYVPLRVVAENMGYQIPPFTSISDDQPFYLRGESVDFYVGLYEYTPYAAGIPEFAIPLASLIPKGSNLFQ